MNRRVALVATLALVYTRAAEAQERSPWIGWAGGDESHREFALGPTIAVDAQRGDGYVGLSARYGFRRLWNTYYQGRSLTSSLVEGFLGESLGIEARAHAWFPWSASGGASTVIALGVAATFDNFLGVRSETSRVRVPAVLGAVLPEIGAAVRTSGQVGFYLAWSIPVAVLVSRSVALELHPSAYLIDGFGLREGASALITLGLTLTVR